MQPQKPASPNPQYDFIMSDKQASQKGLKLPSLGLPKPVKIGLAVLIGLIILIVAYSLLTSGKSSNSQLYASALARAQEIARVSTSVGTLAQDSQTQNLAATTQNALSSEQAQITSYLAEQKIKVSTSSLAADDNTATDTQMQNAATNGNLPGVYASYLKTQLAEYQNDLQSVYKTAGPNGKTILNSAYNSTVVLLAIPQVASAN